MERASVKFSQAVYDGTNDVSVTVEPRGNNVRAVVATGGATLFIEFGAGVTYPDDHPEAEELGMKRGAYGQGHGKQHSWGYYGDPGTNGVLKEKKNTRQKKQLQTAKFKKINPLKKCRKNLKKAKKIQTPAKRKRNNQNPFK